MRKTGNTKRPRIAGKATPLRPRSRKSLQRSIIGIFAAAIIAIGATFGLAPAQSEQQASAPVPQQASSVAQQQSIPQAANSPETAPVQTDAELSADGRYYIYRSTPDFGELAGTTESFEYYSPLDNLGRCGPALACLGSDLMPTEPRKSISGVKPTGWHSVRYDFVDGGSLYNRSHLIAFSLAGENANELNLITGTRQMNLAMSDFEYDIANYIRSTGNHVLYRVTPLFEGDELVARSVQMEALSVEDEGKGICLNVLIPNVQEGVQIDYASGENWAATT